MPDNSKRTGAALEAHYQFLIWLLPTAEKFPRSHKFTLGDRIAIAAFNVLETLIEAACTRERADALRRAFPGERRRRTWPSPDHSPGMPRPSKSLPAMRPMRSAGFPW
jgi:hypothetical protein